MTERDVSLDQRVSDHLGLDTIVRLLYDGYIIPAVGAQSIIVLDLFAHGNTVHRGARIKGGVRVLQREED
jgi:hypothetical protein